MKKKILLTKDRPMTNISMRMPVDLIETLKKVAPLKQMSGYQSLIKYYVGQGLLNDNDLVSQIESEEDSLLTSDDVLAAFDRIKADKEIVDSFFEALHSVRSKPGKAAG